MLAGSAYQSVPDFKEKFRNLPFKEAFSSQEIEKFIAASPAFERERCFTADATLFAFIAQIMSQNNSCKDAVARVRSERVASGQKPCSTNTGCYIRARQKLPHEEIANLTKQISRTLEDDAKPEWLWKGRRAYLFDGSTFSMPDTPENQKAFPQHTNQKKGTGFPLARFVCMTSLATGGLVDFSMGPFIGKGKGELYHASLQLDNLAQGDVVIADRFYLSYPFISLVTMRGADFITKNHVTRNFTVIHKKRLSKKDYLLTLKKPRIPHTGWLSQEKYDAIPETLTIRLTEVTINVAGFRTEKLQLVSTMIDPKKYSKKDLADLYFMRWNVELDIRSMKRVINLNVLRCKKPEMILKEAWVNLLVYNLIRRLMAQAASIKNVAPRQISFTGCIRVMEIYRPIWKNCSKQNCQILYLDMLDAISQELVGDRPGRFEPRLIKRRPHRNYRVLNIPRHKWKEKQKKATA